MRRSSQTRSKGKLRSMVALAIAVAVVVPTAHAADTPPHLRPEWSNESDNTLPVFEYSGLIVDPLENAWNPTDEVIFPSVFHAGAHFDDPLGEWYLYYAPHDNPGGIAMAYADNLSGPWTEYDANPVISNRWDDHYSVSHISSPDAVWREDRGEMFMYFHGENSTTRYATSSDGINFEYGDRVVWNQLGGPNVTETSYARIFPHPDTASEYNWAMFYMGNERDDRRRIRLAESVDGVEWTVDPEYVVAPGPAEGQNVSAANLWEWDGQLYVVYHASSGKIHARAIDETLRNVSDTPQVLHESSGIGDDTGRVASPEIITDSTGTYLFYESGHRLGASIALATMNPDAVRPGPLFPEDPQNPLFGFCAMPGSDEFDGTELDTDLWNRVVRPGVDRHSLVDGKLLIPTYAGGVAAAPLIQQEIPAGPWQVTTEVNVAVSQPFQQAGLLLYNHDTTYTKFILGQSSYGRRVEVVRFLNGSQTQDVVELPETTDAETVWLRFTSNGTLIQASLSLDGVTFNNVGGSFSVAVNALTHVGPLGMRGNESVPEEIASFSWLRWSPTGDEYDACLDVLYPEDVTAPTTDSELSAPVPSSGWYTGPVAVTLTAEDDSEGYGVAQTLYSINGGDPVVYTEPVTVPEGAVEFAYWSVDFSGNAEDPQLLSLQTDTVAPVSTATAVGDEEVEVTVTSEDAASGVAEIEYSLDGGDTWETYTDPLSITRLDVTQTINFRATDVAGNVEDVKSIVIAALVDDGDETPGDGPGDGSDDGSDDGQEDGSGDGPGDDSGNGDATDPDGSDGDLPVTGSNGLALGLIALVGLAGGTTLLLIRRRIKT